MARQRDAGITVPGDGEYGKGMGHRINYGAWWSYSFQRLGGLELLGQGLFVMPPKRSEPGRITLTSFPDRRDRIRFADAYSDPESGVSVGPRGIQWPTCAGPVTYTNVIASTDCGLGGRVHAQIAWAKLETLAQGAAIASKRLWRA